MNTREYRLKDFQTELILELRDQIEELRLAINETNTHKDLTMLNAEDISKIMHCSKQRARDILNDPELKTCQLGRDIRVNKDVFYAYIQKQHTVYDSPYWREVSGVNRRQIKRENI